MVRWGKILENGEEEVNAPNVMLGVVLGFLKQRVSCHDRRRPKEVTNGRYDLQILSFLTLKNARKIAEIERSKMSYLRVINTATPRPIPQQQHLQQLQNEREPCFL